MDELNNTEQVEEVVEQTHEEVKTEGVEALSMTQAELDKLLQSESDKRVTSAIQKAQAKWETEYKEKLETEKSEAEKLAKMSEEEKFKAELDKERAEFASERQKFLKEKLELETVKQLSELNLPTKFSDFLVRETADETSANIKAFSEHWNAEMKSQIEKSVEDKLKGATPTKSNGGLATTMSKEEFGKLNYHDRQKMMTENPDLVKQLLSQQ